MCETIGERIKKLRHGKGMSQEELAKTIGVARMTIVSYESDRNTPDMGIIIKISDFFECSIDYLFGKTEEKNFNEYRNAIEKASMLITNIESMPEKKKNEFIKIANGLANLTVDCYPEPFVETGVFSFIDKYIIMLGVGASALTLLSRDAIRSQILLYIDDLNKNKNELTLMLNEHYDVMVREVLSKCL